LLKGKKASRATQMAVHWSRVNLCFKYNTSSRGKKYFKYKTVLNQLPTPTDKATTKKAVFSVGDDRAMSGQLI